MFQEDLEDALRTKSAQAVFSLVEQNIVSFFSTPDIPKYYQLLKNVDFSGSKRLMPRLIMAWIAFLSGEHARMFALLNNINETDLCSPQESSLLYGLKAFSKSVSGSNEGLKYAKLSLDILPEGEVSFFLANAQLTYGQMLAKSYQFRLAADMFAASSKTFYSFNLPFLAVLATVNECLNRYILGEFAYVIEKCNEALVIGSSYKDGAQAYCDAVHLPLGMCYYEMNKPHLATKHIRMAEESIDGSDLFHMHGMVELYLFKSYYILDDEVAMKELMERAIVNFDHMHLRKTDLLISMFKVFVMGKIDRHLIETDIENLELEYMKNGINSHSIVIETLYFLQLQGITEVISINDLEKRLDKLRYLGAISQIQLAMLQLAELHHMNGQEREAISYLREVANIYKEYGISACLYSMPWKSIELMKKIDVDLYSMLVKDTHKSMEQSEALLTAREREIMALISQGKTNGQIGEELFVTIGTVKWHINNIFGKLGVRNRIQAIKKARSLDET